MSALDALGYVFGIAIGIYIAWYFIDLRRRVIKLQREVFQLRSDMAYVRARGGR